MISIIVPYHNIGWLLGRCLESLSIQTYEDYEVILVDNGSTDNSAKYINEFQRKVRNLHYYRIEYQDINRARNYGLDQATGDYLFFLDGCDFLNKNALHFLYWGLISSSSDMVVGEFSNVGRLTRAVDVTKAPHDINVTKCTPDKMMNKMHYLSAHFDIRFNRIWNKLFKRSLFDGIRFQDGAGSEIEIMQDIVLKCDRIGVEGFVMYFRAEKPEDVADITLAEVYENKIKFFKENLDTYGWIYVRHSCYLLITNLLYIYRGSRDPDIRAYCIKRINEIRNEYPDCIPNGNNNMLAFIKKISRNKLTN